MSESLDSRPLVSIIMPFLNAAPFIQEAIESVLAQTYSRWELVFVNDGCTDASARLAAEYVERYPGQMHCIRHPDGGNHGIAASRNAGVKRASGEYIAFLDADDVWLPQHLARQVAILEREHSAAMVFGRTQYWYSWTGDAGDLQRDFVPDLGVPGDALYSPPTLLLTLYPLGQGTAPNPSNLLVRRSFLDEVGGFEEEFRGLYEDQTFLVKAYLRAPVYVSSECWDKYRIHPDSCLSIGTAAGQYEAVRSRFLDWFNKYLEAHRVEDETIRAAVNRAQDSRGTPQEVVHYGEWQFRAAGGSEAKLVIPADQPDAVRVVIGENAGRELHDIQLNRRHLRVQDGRTYRVVFRARADEPRRACYGIALGHEPWTGLGLYESIELTPQWQSFATEFIATADEENARIHFDLGQSRVAVEVASVSLQLPEGVPAPAGVEFGTLRRVSPISRSWGFDRGVPIDRYYIESFLARHSADIRGRVLEIGDNTYTRRFGGRRVTRSEVLHVHHGNPMATIVGDLTDAPHIASDSLDCVILTQTLQLIYDVRAAVSTLHRILRPNGVVLATLPGISQNCDGDWCDTWYWNFTPQSARRLFGEAFGKQEVVVDAAGNVLSAIAFLHGISMGELTPDELDHRERGYEVTIGVRATKPTVRP